MPILVDSIKQEHPSLSDKIVFDPYLIADDLENVPPGTYYKSSKSSNKMNKKVNDTSKRTIFMTHQRYLRSHFPKATTIDYWVYDDLTKLYSFHMGESQRRNDNFHYKIFFYKGDKPTLFGESFF